eukprot:TRINITY_DN11194_c0_g1_i1.p1 TRINITY_DN11194_c0_g1~~TRINITY_DN11194_c0_g1_i1.p1  ORF type:complete len:423 (-),score=78.18 TRINITY_DN11194_c0_g1_i1:136-1404(-)
MRLLSSCAMLVCACSAAVLPRTFVWNASDIASVLERVKQGDPSVMPSVQAAVFEAEKALKQQPVSVTTKPYVPPSGNKHDYMSLDKYYWPCNVVPPSLTAAERGAPECNETTGLPWVRHDGVTNPAMHLYDHDRLINMTSAVTKLGVAYYFTGDERYASHAADLLTTWFLDPTTMMNPNLNFGHFVPGVANGTHGGFIDVHQWPEMLDAISLLGESKSWTGDKETALRLWFAEFATWAVVSNFGAGESAETNNHGVWYDVLVSGTALYSGKQDVAAIIARDALTKRVLVQVQPNGELPAELARTKSWSYTEFCTEALLQLTAVAYNSGVDLAHGANSRLRTTIDFQLPYVTGSKPWNWTQIVPFYPPNCTITDVDQCVGSYYTVLRKAANFYHSSTYEKVIPTLPGVNATANMINLVLPKRT